MPNQFLIQNKLERLERPFRELMTLNMKIIQNFSYIKPTELLSSNKPEHALEKHMEVMIANGHQVLDYMQDVFLIMEKHWTDVSSISNEAIDQSQDAIRKTHKVASNAMKKGIKTGAKAVTRVPSPVKNKKAQATKTATASNRTSASKNKSKTSKPITTQNTHPAKKVLQMDAARKKAK